VESGTKNTDPRRDGYANSRKQNAPRNATEASTKRSQKQRVLRFRSREQARLAEVASAKSCDTCVFVFTSFFMTSRIPADTFYRGLLAHNDPSFPVHDSIHVERRWRRVLCWVAEASIGVLHTVP